MEAAAKHKLILKILIGAAWVDRHLEPEEVAYLQRILERYGLQGDRELLSLLQSPIDIQTTETWVAEYFRKASQDERMQLLVKIGQLLMADDQVTEIEHDLLDDYYDLMAYIPAQAESAPRKTAPETNAPKTNAPKTNAPETTFMAEAKKVVQHIGQFVTQILGKALHR